MATKTANTMKIKADIANLFFLNLAIAKLERDPEASYFLLLKNFIFVCHFYLYL
jgi:hypothetical protein